MTGLSTSTSISFGCALVAGRNRVPRPAAGKTALRTGPAMALIVSQGRIRVFTLAWTPARRGCYTMNASAHVIDPALLRDNLKAVQIALANRGIEMTRELEEVAAL